MNVYLTSSGIWDRMMILSLSEQISDRLPEVGWGMASTPIGALRRPQRVVGSGDRESKGV